jgi:hypothetical protein
MPGCFRGKDQTGGDKASDDVPPHQDWREPPGYLGEAVRRAKRISKPKDQNAPGREDH